MQDPIYVPPELLSIIAGYRSKIMLRHYFRHKVLPQLLKTIHKQNRKLLDQFYSGSPPFKIVSRPATIPISERKDPQNDQRIIYCYILQFRVYMEYGDEDYEIDITGTWGKDAKSKCSSIGFFESVYRETRNSPINALFDNRNMTLQEHIDLNANRSLHIYHVLKEKPYDKTCYICQFV